MEKRALRREMKRRRQAISEAERQDMSRIAWHRLWESKPFQRAQTIFLYLGFGSEMETAALAEECWKRGKRTAFPRVTGPRQMEFFYATALNDFEAGSYGVLEPPYEEAKRALPDAGTVILVPGLAFDRRGYRIGYGGGYYDAYLTRYPDCTAIGTCFDFQLLTEDLPAEAHDRTLQYVVTPEIGMMSVKTELQIKGAALRDAARELSNTGSTKKDEGLLAAANALRRHQGEILAANGLDVQAAREKGVREAMIDRLILTEQRIDKIAQALENLTSLRDPVGEVLWMRTRPNGLRIGKKRVPLGVVGIIYESRPNVTADAFGLCFKSGNGVMLRGGSDAIQSNTAIVAALKEGLREAGLNPDAVQLVEDTSRETAAEMMRLREFIDVLIPRGGAGLIQSVVNEATIPVIETGTGNCHIFVDESADLSMAVSIAVNAKTQRPGVCNAAESLLVHERAAASHLPAIAKALMEKGVELRGDEQSLALVPGMKPATEEDWGTEYTDLIMSVKIVRDIGEAIQHINRYNTRHSEAIITQNYANAERFLQEIDAAAVYVNASTRFTDGEEFGFGAEIGISTQKLHATGPMGLEELTATKYVVYGDGQIRS